jgi:hypothetical protein
MKADHVGGILSREAQIGLDAYWRVKRFAYNLSEFIEYMGCNNRLDAEITADTWAIWKYTYSGNNVSIIEGPITGVWDNRATLDWN